MKIIFLTASPRTPSTRYRVLQNLAVWRKLGLEVEAVPLPQNNRKRLQLLFRLPGYDVVVLQKRLLHRHSLFLLRRFCRKLVYDFDDAVMYSDSNRGEFFSPRKEARFTAVARAADLLVAGNDYLAREARKARGRRVAVVPTGVDCEYFRPPGERRPPFHPLTLGWIGSRPNLLYLEALAEPLNRLYEKRRDFTLKVVCDSFPQGFACPVKKVAWSAASEVRELQSCDIGLMPLSEDPWTKGKCAFKLLQYMACGLPAVASENEVTRKIVTPGKNGFLARDAAEMVMLVGRLLAEPEKLAVIGNAARNSLIGRYDHETVARAYAELLAGLCGRQ